MKNFLCFAFFQMKCNTPPLWCSQNTEVQMSNESHGVGYTSLLLWTCTDIKKVPTISLSEKAKTTMGQIKIHWNYNSCLVVPKSRCGKWKVEVNRGMKKKPHLFKNTSTHVLIWIEVFFLIIFRYLYSYLWLLLNISLLIFE